VVRARRARPPCESCQQPIARHGKRFCSVRCQQQFQYRRFIAAWLAGEVSGAPNLVNVSDHVRRYLIELAGGCVLCGWAEVNPHTGRSPLHIDHIDGDYRNNTLSNLRVLCPNCHALTATYGALNRGHGRPFHVIKTRRAAGAEEGS
jgi:endogenous inhibitor of DNA gyrase (YacG/DUF329 family)